MIDDGTCLAREGNEGAGDKSLGSPRGDDDQVGIGELVTDSDPGPTNWDNGGPGENGQDTANGDLDEASGCGPPLASVASSGESPELQGQSVERMVSCPQLYRKGDTRLSSSPKKIYNLAPKCAGEGGEDTEEIACQTILGMEGSKE